MIATSVVNDKKTFNWSFTDNMMREIERSSIDAIITFQLRLDRLSDEIRFISVSESLGLGALFIQLRYLSI